MSGGRATLELTVSPEYVGSWGMWEAARELLQNGIDREVSTGGASPMRVKYSENAGVLTVTSEDTVIERRTLVLGSTDKDGQTTLGKYGEGYKLALVVLLRLGKKVQIANGSEMWTPRVAHSEAFGMNLVRVDIEPTSKENRDLVFSVGGVSLHEWRVIRKRTLKLSQNYKCYKTTKGSVLMGPEHERMIYVGGLYICTLPKNGSHQWVHGFDFNPGEVSLDRDRRMIAEWEVEYNAAQMFHEVDDEEKVANMIEAGNRDVVDYFRISSEKSAGVASVMMQNFTQKYGEGALPAEDEDNAEELRRAYPKAKVVVVGPNIAQGVRQAPQFPKYLEGFEHLAPRDTSPWAMMVAWLDEHRAEIQEDVVKSFEDDLLTLAMKWRAE
jgi:hypothetical protein